jgi:hypothetical protein
MDSDPSWVLHQVDLLDENLDDARFRAEACDTAHQLLQVRTRVLNGQLRAHFERWNPRLRSASDPLRLAA